MDDLTLDTAAFRWREALDAATDSLDKVSRSREALHFSSAELQARVARLERERDATEHDLELLAGTTHTHLHRHLHGPRARVELLGLGTVVEGCVFELDGVLAPSAELHAAAWQETFDEFLARHKRPAGCDPLRPFEARGDYFRYLHGRPRIDGVLRFLDGRGIRLPHGDPSEVPGYDTAWGLAARKNAVLRRLLRRDGIRAYGGSIRFLELGREAHLRLAVVSASANTVEILERAGLLGLVDSFVDGAAMATERLRPKPEPDTILTACGRLGIAPAAAATFDTTHAGVAAARRAGVDRAIVVDLPAGSLNGARAADRVVSELSELIDPKLT